MKEEIANQIPIFRYEPSSLRGEVIAPRGSVVVFLAASGSERLAAIRAAAAGPPTDALLQDVDLIDDDGILVTVSYAGRSLAERVPVPRDGRPVRLILPYAGGDLEQGDLRVLAAEGADLIEAVAVRHDPPLTAVEQAALTLLPRNVLSVNLGAALPGGIAMDNDEERRRQEEEQRRAADEARAERAAEQAEARAEAAEARAEARREARAAGRGSRVELHLLDATIKTLSPLQTANAMLEIRRDLLSGQMEHG